MINRLLPLLAVCLMASYSPAQELRWKLKAGDELVAKIEQKSEITSTIGGTDSVMTVATGMELAWKVETVDEPGNATISQRFQRLTMTLEMPKAGPINYDSAKAADARGDVKTIADAVGPLLEASATVTLTPRGEITSVVLDDSIKKGVEKLANAKALQSLLSREGLTKVLQQSLIVLPEGDTTPEQTWQREAVLDSPLGKMKQTTTFKLLEPDDKSPNVARIESDSKLEPADTAKSKATLKSQSQRGLILFDAAAGRLQSATIDQELVTSTALKETPIQVQLVSQLKTTLEAK